MLQIGQEVVLMSAAGRFKIVAIDGDLIVIENDLGIQRKVRQEAVRTVAPREA